MNGSKENRIGDELRFPYSNRVARNRLLKAPMTERMASFSPHDMAASGVVTPELIQLYQTWGKGEIGVIVTGNILIDGEHIEAAGNVILENESHDRMEPLRKMVAAAQEYGSLFIAQISHPGRQANVLLQPNPLGASDIQITGSKMGMNFGRPRALTEAGIQAIVKKFGETARLCYEAGFDGVQLHAAHGYLLSQFLSTRTNNRVDKYGGSLNNRARIIFEVIDEIRERVNDNKFIIGVKVNSFEFMDGFTAKDCMILCQQLEQRRVDFVELSGGTYEDLNLRHQKASTVAREAYFIEFARMIAPVLTTTIPYLTGGFRSVGAMTRAWNDGSCLGCGMGRPFCDDPNLAKKMISSELISAPAQKIDDSAMTVVAAGVQMTRIAHGLQPLDLARRENVERLQHRLQEWMIEVAERAKKGAVIVGHLQVL